MTDSPSAGRLVVVAEANHHHLKESALEGLLLDEVRRVRRLENLHPQALARDPAPPRNLTRAPTEFSVGILYTQYIFEAQK